MTKTLLIILAFCVHFTIVNSILCSYSEANTVADCSVNQISSPINYFPELSDQVVRVDLSGNELTELTMTASSSKRLTHINLNHNKIVLITLFTFSNWSAENNLTELELAYNRLTTLDPKMFYGLQRLTYLQLEGNHIQVLHDDTFAPLLSLLSLSLASNTLHTIELHAFRNLTQLETLNIDNNNVGSLDFLEPLEGLKVANFSNNSIISPNLYTFREQLKLEYLQLDQNKIAFISDNTFYHLSSLQV